MSEVQAQRTLVKSPPELWAEVTDANALARRLDGFGAVRITRVEPETTVEWEGDRARGRIEIDASGWGTKVTLFAQADAPSFEALEQEARPAEDDEADRATEAHESRFEALELQAGPHDVPAAMPDGDEPATIARRGLLDWLLGRRTSEPGEPAPDEPDQAGETAVVDEPAAAAESPPPAEESEPPVEQPESSSAAGEPQLDPQRTLEILDGVLDDLGAAHHRPFSRG